jgi:hypothetical protein
VLTSCNCQRGFWYLVVCIRFLQHHFGIVLDWHITSIGMVYSKICEIQYSRPNHTSFLRDDLVISNPNNLTAFPQLFQTSFGCNKQSIKKSVKSLPKRQMESLGYSFVES